MSNNYDEVLRNALRVADEAHPDSHPYRRAAFANAVAAMLTGVSGGYGGPSVRENAVRRLGQSTQDFDEACKLAEPIVFGPLTDLHRECWQQEYCFQDDPADLKELTKST